MAMDSLMEKILNLNIVMSFRKMEENRMWLEIVDNWAASD